MKYLSKSLMLLAVVVLLASCKKESSEKQILSFSFFRPAVEATITESAKTIEVTVSGVTDVTALVPIIVVSEKASVNPASGIPQDFTNPVTYTVTAEDGSQAVYTVTVTVENGGIFSVSETKKVRFAPGNLYATNHDGTWTWAFEEGNYSGDFERFGWSTGSTYFGIDYSVNYSDYSGDFVDWGNNTITNGEDYTWFTLSISEWFYLFDNHTNGWTIVNGSHGWMLRPDGVTTAIASSYTAEAWAAEEAAGALFLPAAGYREEGNGILIGERGFYWSSSPHDENYAWSLYFREGEWDVGRTDRFIGRSVRLARLAE